MGLKKILQIENLGRFEQIAPGYIKFQKATLVYAGNGTGKTTLASIFHSLRTGDPNFLKARETIEGTGDPIIKMIFRNPAQNEVPVDFEGSWGTSPYELEVFDADFVRNNVHTGARVETEHRRNLYRFVIGEQGVILDSKIGSLNDEISALTTSLKTQESAINRHVIPQFEFGDFIVLKPLDDLEKLIAEAEAEKIAKTQEKAISKQAEFSTIALPDIQKDPIIILLKKSIDDISQDAEEQTQKHLEKQKMPLKGKDWIREGLGYISNNDCPMCGNDITSNSLISAYQDYFNEAYEELKEEIGVFIENTSVSFAHGDLVKATETFEKNITLTQFWGQHFKIELNHESLKKEVETTWIATKEKLLDVLTGKQQAPLESISLGSEIEEGLATYAELRIKVSEYNSLVGEMNNKIQALKASMGAVSLAEIEKRLNHLKNNEARYKPDVVLLCNEFINRLSEKKAKEKEKGEVKKELDAYEKDLLKKYEKRINAHLDMFGAGFKIADTKSGYPSGKPASNYSIMVRNESVKLTSKQEGERSFRTVLSEGDKSTLAFAFFLAKLESDDKIAQKIVVFDDPISSLDSHRTQCTCDGIIETIQKAYQVIIMSHDPSFLHKIWDNPKIKRMRKDGNVGTIEIYKKGETSDLKDWDIDEAMQDDYFRAIDTLKAYLNQPVMGTMNTAGKALRPVLEGYLRMRYPDVLPPGGLISSYIADIKKANQGDPLYPIKESVDELEKLNRYTLKFHHDQSGNQTTTTDTEPTELVTYINRVLNFIHGYKSPVSVSVN